MLDYVFGYCTFSSTVRSLSAALTFFCFSWSQSAQSLVIWIYISIFQSKSSLFSVFTCGFFHYNLVDCSHSLFRTPYARHKQFINFFSHLFVWYARHIIWWIWVLSLSINRLKYVCREILILVSSPLILRHLPKLCWPSVSSIAKWLNKITNISKTNNKNHPCT